MALTVVLIVELVAIVLTFARVPIGELFWLELARISLLLIWIALTGTALLCSLRPKLATLGTVGLSIGGFLVILGVTAAIAEATWWIGLLTLGGSGGGPQLFFPQRHGPFLLGSLAVSAVVCALLLRYFYVTHQWRLNLERQAQARIGVLQARMRPHFLFNSMNTIASLTRSDPAAAEAAVEDVAELMRASLSDTGQRIPLRQEIEVCRVYARVEQQRLRERLRVDWQIDDVPMDVPIPALTLQPLLENAIYHGVERLTEGGTVSIRGQVLGKQVELMIHNPAPRLDTTAAPPHQGNRMALANIHERLALISEGRARLDTHREQDGFRATLTLPMDQSRDESQ
ncbi:MAG: histidine kinase [Pseudomonadota bacterium]